jgi:hypothetical protein
MESLNNINYINNINNIDYADNADNSEHPWRNKDRLINLYDLFTADIIPCLSKHKNDGLCFGKECQLAHVNDSYKKSIKYACNYPDKIEKAIQNYKEWNHYQYLLTIKDKMHNQINFHNEFIIDLENIVK